MRLSLRTLLAFEDNVFDVEQHRRLEQLLPADKTAEATLRRVRSIVRNPSLGVPGLVDHQEELDPNYVAEYLDHQMSGSVQEKFEAYCLSADKYLAEIASVHHILSNVLGEPARTSRECRLRCYEVLHTDKNLLATPIPEQWAHFQPHGASPESKAGKLTRNRYFAPLWNLLFPSKPVPETPAVPTEKRSPFWTFAVLGLFICVLLLGWQQIEKKRFAHQQSIEVGTIAGEPGIVSLYPIPQAENFVDENHIANGNDYAVTAFTDEHHLSEQYIADTDESNVIPAPADQRSDRIESPMPLVPLEVIEQVVFASETFPSFTGAPTENTSAATADVSQVPLVELARFESLNQEGMPSDNSDNIASEEELTGLEKDSIVAFQAIVSPTIPATESATRPNAQSPHAVSAWQPIEKPEELEGPIAPQLVSIAMVQQPSPNLSHSTPMTAPVIVPRVVGRAVELSPSGLIFSAASSGAPWQLPSLPFDLNGEQYLLTAAPFRGTFELAAGFRIEMIGDAKLCILPPDASGTPGIFVDYGRIILYPLKPNQPLRIETERSRGLVRATGTESILFIDTFAEVSESPGAVKLTEEQRPRMSPILGFVPRNGEQIVWKSVSQPQPFYANSLGSVLLQSERYRFGEVRNLPNWLALPVTLEDRMLAEVCRRYFAEAHGDGEQALTRLMRDESPAVRTLGLRLWGDLGRFDVPIAVMAERRQGEEAIRHVLNQYFEEIMRRDEETIQRFADALQFVKETQVQKN